MREPCSACREVADHYVGRVQEWLASRAAESMAASVAVVMRGSERASTGPIGGSRVVRSSEGDRVTLIGAGITLHEALQAADRLADEGIAARVIDLYSIKPIDADTLVAAANQTGRLVTVEDHWPEGGIGEAVLATLAEHDTRARVIRLAVNEMPGSATPAEQLAAAGIDAAHIVDAARAIVAEAAPAAAS